MIRSLMPPRKTPLKATTIRASGKRKAGCDCETCRPNVFGDMRMIVCAICGNKRCPHATDHCNACTGSNEPGQSGSSWAEVKPFPKRKASRPKMTEARKSAKGQPCMVRLPGVCNGDPETTVLAHYRLSGYCGTGLKPPDEMGAWACSACHDECDRRTHKYADPVLVKLAHAEAVLRTQQAMKEME